MKMCLKIAAAEQIAKKERKSTTDLALEIEAVIFEGKERH